MPWMDINVSFLSQTRLWCLLLSSMRLCQVGYWLPALWYHRGQLSCCGRCLFRLREATIANDGDPETWRGSRNYGTQIWVSLDWGWLSRVPLRSRIRSRISLEDHDLVLSFVSVMALTIDFLDRCRPLLGDTNPSIFTLSNSSVCTRTTLLKDGYRSFPSGHCSSTPRSLSI